MNEENQVRDPKRRREIIKTILIIFLAALLVLTFCSNTIMNKSLPEISTERVSSGKLTERVRGSGMVISNQTYDVTVDGNKTVDTIMVKTGKEVKKDDVLFTVSKTSSDTLAAEEATLAELDLAYQKALLAPPADYSTEDQSIKNARADLNAAIARRDAAIASQGSAQAEKAAYDQNKADLSYQTKLQGKLSATIAAIDSDEYSAAAPEYTGALVELHTKAAEAEADYNAAFEVYSQILAEGGDVSALQADLDRKQSARDSARDQYDNEKFSVRAGLVDQLSEAESQIDWLTAATAEYESGLAAGEGSSLDALEADVLLKQQSLETLITELNKTKTENSNQSKLNDLDLQAAKQAADKQREKVEKLKKESEVTEIKAKYSGVVSAVNIKPGEETVPDMPALTIDISEEGYTLEVTVDAEKAKKVKTGAEAEIINNWYGDMQAVLSEIKSDTVAGSRNKRLIFSITGTVEPNAYLEVSIPCGSGNYDAIVPNSAVHEDTKGKFVLTVTSKSSPLGNRYYAERVDVEVLAKDELSSAVSGAIYSGDHVITTSSSNIKPGSQVRMKDN
ncbi:MAG: RND transporter [Ruminococcus sp.]|nr:RND transporter [Ruminococcus sp.]